MHAYKISIMFVKEIKYQYVQFFLIKGEQSQLECSGRADHEM